MSEERITYQEIKEALAEKIDLSVSQSDELIKNFIAIIQQGLKRDEKVYIPKFGTFELQLVGARDGYNPQTEEKIFIPEHKRVVFKPRKALRSQVNKRFKNLESYPVNDNSKPAKQKVAPWVWAILGILLIGGGVVYYEVNKDMSYLQHLVGSKVSSSHTTSKEKAKISEHTRIINVADYDVYKMENKNHLYNLARELYKDPKYWPLLFFANYTDLYNPDRLPVLQKMKVYDVDPTVKQLTKKDKKMMSMAYGVVSRSYYYSGNYKRYQEYKKRAEEFYKF